MTQAATTQNITERKSIGELNNDAQAIAVRSSGGNSSALRIEGQSDKAAP